MIACRSKATYIQIPSFPRPFPTFLPRESSPNKWCSHQNLAPKPCCCCCCRRFPAILTTPLPLIGTAKRGISIQRQSQRKNQQQNQSRHRQKRENPLLGLLGDHAVTHRLTKVSLTAIVKCGQQRRRRHRLPRLQMLRRRQFMMKSPPVNGPWTKMWRGTPKVLQGRYMLCAMAEGPLRLLEAPAATVVPEAKRRQISAHRVHMCICLCRQFLWKLMIYV